MVSRVPEGMKSYAPVETRVNGGQEIYTLVGLQREFLVLSLTFQCCIFSSEHLGGCLFMEFDFP